MLGEYLNVITAYTEFPSEIWLTTVCISYNWSSQDSLLRLNGLMSRSPSMATQTYCRTCRLDPRTSCCVSGWIKHTQLISHTDTHNTGWGNDGTAIVESKMEMLLIWPVTTPCPPALSPPSGYISSCVMEWHIFHLPCLLLDAKTQQNPAQCQVGLHK